MGPRSAHVAAGGDDIGCKCPACLETELPRVEQELPYRYAPGTGRIVYHLALHTALPIAGMVLIGRSWWALAPILGFLAAYLANALILCPSCPYHHSGVRFCGCYPKSIFPYKQYLGKRWRNRENIIGRSLVITMTIAPSFVILVVRGEPFAVLFLLLCAVSVIFLTSVFSCPNCRQRDVCYLGRLTTAGIGRKDF